MTESEAKTILETEIVHHPECSIFAEAIDIAIQALEKQINRCWVPCKDRLPEEVNKFYLVTYRSVIFEKLEQNVTVSYLSTFSNGDKIWEIEEEPGNKRMVTAWQPLPKPYKEGKESETD